VVSGGTRLAAVIGSPVRHSLSPAIHNAAFAALGLDWVFVALEVAPGAAPAAVEGMRVLGIDGLSVTMPHKEAVADAVDDLTPDARALHAVNCVARDGQRLVGHNTDGDGFVASLRAGAGVDPKGCRAVVLGAGGAARSLVLALVRAGATEVVVVNRSPERAKVAAALASAARVGDTSDIAVADLVVNATPIGMGADEGLPFDRSLLQRGQLVADLVYHPLDTPLLRAARACGASTLDGLGMLVHQAARQLQLWTGMEPPVADMRAAAEAELRRRPR